MLHLILYKHSNDTLQAQISQQAQEKDNVLLVAPNPGLADYYRERYSDYEVTTVASFLANILMDFLPEHKESFRGKADLLTLLAASWHKQFPNRSFDDFEYCYNILSDLRSYSVAADILNTVLEEYPEKIKEGVLLLYRVMNALEIYDEHEAYFRLAEYLREGSWIEKEHARRTYIFIGFRFFTGIQIDFLKALAIAQDVFIPLAKNIYDQAKLTDWPKWLEDSRLVIHELDEQSNDDDQVGEQVTVNLFNADELNRVLKKLDEQNYFKNHDLLLLDGSLNLEKVQELPLKDLGYKVPLSLLVDHIDWINQELSELKAKNQELALDDILNFLKNQIVETKKDSDYIKIKTYILYHSVVSEWAEWLGTDSKLTDFDLAHFYFQAGSKQTRNSLYTDGKTLYDKNSLLTPNYRNRLAICMTSKYQALKTTGEKYSTQIEKILTPIGPIRRPAFDFLFFKEPLIEIINEQKADFWLDQESYENDLGLKELFDNRKVEINMLSVPSVYREAQDVLLEMPLSIEKSSYISATRLQTYIDCPRKFHLNYQSDLRLDKNFEHELQIFEVGQVQHAVIEEYSKEFDRFDQNDFSAFVPKVFNKFLKKTNKNLSKLDYQVALNEISIYAANGLKELYKIPFELKKFEVNLKEYAENISGRIDFYGKTNDVLYLIDFKRSSGSIPSKSEVLDFNKIQLSFYLNKLALKEDIQKVVVGYMDLSDPSASLYFLSEEIDKDLLDHYNFCSGASFYHFDSLKEFMNDYDQLEKKLVETMDKDKHFYPKPRDIKACRYCMLKNLCPKSVLESKQ